MRHTLTRIARSLQSIPYRSKAVACIGTLDVAGAEGGSNPGAGLVEVNGGAVFVPVCILWRATAGATGTQTTVCDKGRLAEVLGSFGAAVNRETNTPTLFVFSY